MKNPLESNNVISFSRVLGTGWSHYHQEDHLISSIFDSRDNYMCISSYECSKVNHQSGSGWTIATSCQSMYIIVCTIAGKRAGVKGRGSVRA